MPHLDVTVGTLISKDPNKVVGKNALGAQFWEIYVEIIKVDNEPLIRPDGCYRRIRDVIEANISWLLTFIINILA